MHTAASLAESLRETVETEVPHLRAIPDGPATSAPNRPSGAGWSQREELGHLVDSAVNNHARFARAAIGPAYDGPGYDADAWVAVHRYRDMAWGELVDIWAAHNRVLVPLVANLTAAGLATPCTVGAGAPVTLAFLVDDYVLHMQHHLDQVLGRHPPRRYPRAAR